MLREKWITLFCMRGFGVSDLEVVEMNAGHLE